MFAKRGDQMRIVSCIQLLRFARCRQVSVTIPSGINLAPVSPVREDEGSWTTVRFDDRPEVFVRPLWYNSDIPCDSFWYEGVPSMLEYDQVFFL